MSAAIILTGNTLLVSVKDVKHGTTVITTFAAGDVLTVTLLDASKEPLAGSTPAPLGTNTAGGMTVEIAAPATGGYYYADIVGIIGGANYHARVAFMMEE